MTGSGAAALAETVTVAALGDSLTQGYGLPADQGLVPQLQDWLAARGVDATVLNAGVSGDTTAGGLARADWTLTDDVDALIVALGGNDLLRGLPPDQAKANLAGVLDKAKARGLPVLLVGMRATRNYGGDYKAEFDAIYPDLAKTYGVAFYPYFWAPLAAAIEGGTPQGELFQDDGIHPNAKGVALVVEGIGPAVADLVAKATR